MSKPLTFAELAPNDHFIAFPVDGDDSGHGGFRNGSYLFRKLEPREGQRHNAMQDWNGSLSHMPEGMEVLKVLLRRG